jgi:hypothetical protein
MIETELNETGLAVVTDMFGTLQAHGSKAAKMVRARHCAKYGTAHVDWAARTWMKERQAEFNSVGLFLELRQWAHQRFPFHHRYGRTARPSRRRAERRD